MRIKALAAITCGAAVLIGSTAALANRAEETVADTSASALSTGWQKSDVTMSRDNLNRVREILPVTHGPEAIGVDLGPTRGQVASEGRVAISGRLSAEVAPTTTGALCMLATADREPRAAGCFSSLGIAGVGYLGVDSKSQLLYLITADDVQEVSLSTTRSKHSLKITNGAAVWEAESSDEVPLELDVLRAGAVHHMNLGNRS